MTSGHATVDCLYGESRQVRFRLLQFYGFTTEAAILLSTHVTSGGPSEGQLSDVDVVELGKQFMQQCSVTFFHKRLKILNQFFTHLC